MAQPFSTRSLAAVVTLIAAACGGAPQAPPPQPAGPIGPPASVPPPPPAAALRPVAAPAGPAAQAGPEPIDHSLPTAAPPSLDLRSSCVKGTCAHDLLVPDEVMRSLPPSTMAAIWEEAIADKAEAVFPVDAGVEVVGLVVDGAIEVRPKEKGTPKLTIDARWHGFRAPGGGISIAAVGKAARVIVVVAAAAPDASLADHVARLKKKDKQLAWTERQKRIDHVDFNKTNDLGWGNGAYHARIGWEASSYTYGAEGGKGKKTWDVADKPMMVVDLLRFSKNADVAEHAHDKEQECLAFLEGQGELVFPGASTSTLQVKPGTVTCLAAGVRHAWKPAGTTPTFAIQVYTPPGPEQRFKMNAQVIEPPKPASAEKQVQPPPAGAAK